MEENQDDKMEWNGEDEEFNGHPPDRAHNTRIGRYLPPFASHNGQRPARNLLPQLDDMQDEDQYYKPT